MGQYHNTDGRVINTETGYIPINIRAAHLAAGTALAAFADGASDVPGLALANSEATGIRWNNHAAPLAIWTSYRNPADRKPGTDITLHFVCSKVGATVGDAVTLLVAAFNQVVGALHDADANFGGTSGAITGDAATKTVQKVTLTLASANLESGVCATSLSIKPTDGTLGTDDFVLHEVYGTYERALTPN